MGPHKGLTIKLNIRKLNIGKLNIRKLLYFNLAIALLLSCKSIYYLSNSKAVYFYVFTVISLCLIHEIHDGISKKCFLVLALYGVFALMTDFFVKNTTMSFRLKYYLFAFIFILVNCCWSYPKKISFLEVMEKIIFFLAVSSTILWVLEALMNLLSPITSYIVSWGRTKTYYSYYGLYFAESIQYKTVFGVEIARNLSIYPEGPFSELIFSLGLVIYLLTHEDRKKIKIALYLAAIFSTLSSIGWIMAVVIVGVDFVKRSSRAKGRYMLNRRMLRYVLPTVIIILGIYIICYFLEYKASTDLANYTWHTSALISGFRGFLKSPINGVGIGESGELYDNTTSGLLKIMGDGGIIFTLLNVFPGILILCKSGFGKRNYQIAYFTGFILIMVALVIWQDTLLFLFFLAMGYSLLIEGLSSGTNRFEKNTLSIR